MKNIGHLFRSAIIILSLTVLNSCSDQQEEDIYKQLETKAKITTFPLTIVLTSNLSGDNFPDDLKSFVAVSTGPCKTLPVAGILRLGPDQYYTYNGVSALTLPPGDNDEKSVTSSVIGQINDYLSKTTLKDFDSLRAPIRSDFTSQILATDYSRTTNDSVFVYSAMADASDLTVMGGRSYPVYRDAAVLRRKIDEMICSKQATISIIYTPSSTSGALPGAGADVPRQGMYAGDTCVGTSKFEKLNDGRGNLFVGRLLEENSKSCGFNFPTGDAGDTCIGKSRYQRLHNGRGGFMLGSLVEKNSTACGFTFPTGLAGDSCSNGSKYQKMHDGRGGFVLGNMIEKNSRACGFKPPVVVAAVPVPAKTVTRVPLVTKPVTNPVPTKPVTNSVPTKPVTNPVPTKPVTNPVPTKPVTNPVPTKPATNQPANKTPANPPANKPATNPVVTKPVIKPLTNPVVTRPPVTKPPVITSPAPTTRPEQTETVPSNRGTSRADELPDSGTPSASATKDKRCVKTSDAVCEQDAGGNYTGRRVQYCYNAAGKIVRTIVVSKCESDCRCIGK